MITISVCLPTRWRWHSPGVCVSKGMISAKEYAKIDTIIAKKFGISSCSIFR